MSLIDVTVKNTDGLRRLDAFSYNLSFFSVAGTREAGYFLVNKIQEITGETKYSKSLDVVTDYAKMVTWVSPGKTFFEASQTASDEAYQERFHRCTYFQYLAKKEGELEPALKRISDSKAYEPNLRVIVTRSLGEIKKIIIDVIVGRV